jgi:hypothetical protein
MHIESNGLIVDTTEELLGTIRMVRAAQGEDHPLIAASGTEERQFNLLDLLYTIEDHRPLPRHFVGEERVAIEGSIKAASRRRSEGIDYQLARLMRQEIKASKSSKIRNFVPQAIGAAMLGH